MRRKTTASLFAALLAALTWLDGTATAGPQRVPVPGGGPSGPQQKKPWGCEDTADMVACSLCCLNQAAVLRQHCIQSGFDEDFCEDRGQLYLENCEAAACM